MFDGVSESLRGRQVKAVIVQVRQEPHFLRFCLCPRQAMPRLRLDRPDKFPPTASYIYSGKIQPILQVKVLRPVAACTNAQLRVLTFPATQAFPSLSASRSNWRRGNDTTANSLERLT